MHDAITFGMRCATLVAIGLVLGSARSEAECRRDDHPVVLAATQALRTGDFTPIAAWVQPADEQALQAAFRRARRVRDPVSDYYFVETVLRFARLPCTQVADAIDRALLNGDDSELVELVVDRVRMSLHERFRDVSARADHRRGDLEGARAYVARYTALVQYVVALYTAAALQPVPIAEPIPHER
jgi:hypothetical protein